MDIGGTPEHRMNLPEVHGRFPILAKELMANSWNVLGIWLLGIQIWVQKYQKINSKALGLL